MPSPIEKPGTNRAFSLVLGRRNELQKRGYFYVLRHELRS